MTNLQERIFSKAGIDNSYIHHPATFNAPKEAVPYFVFSNTSFKNGISEEFPGFSDGGMQSNAVDLARFANALLDGKLLSPDIRKQLWTAEVPMGRGGQYALGWTVDDNPYNKQLVGHSGGGKGFSTYLSIAVEDEYVIVVTINNRQNPRDVVTNILKLLYTGSYDKPQKPLENFLFEQVEQKGWTNVREHFSSILAEKGLTNIPTVWTYIRLMEMCADSGRPDIALHIMDMAVKDFPKESPPYIVAAQIASGKGDKDSAREYYEKALQINPQDEFAKNALKNMH